MTQPPSIGNHVCAYSAAAIATPLPPEVVARAKLHILDTLAAIVSGAALEPGQAAQAYVRALNGPAVATVLGSREKVPLVEAALANGMAAHADESDDSHERQPDAPRLRRGAGRHGGGRSAALERRGPGARRRARLRDDDPLRHRAGRGDDVQELVLVEPRLWAACSVPGTPPAR